MNTSYDTMATGLMCYLMECYQGIKHQYFKPTNVFNYQFNQFEVLVNHVPQETKFQKKLRCEQSFKRERNILGQINLRNNFILNHHGFSQSLQCSNNNVTLQQGLGGKDTQVFLKLFSCRMEHNSLSWNTNSVTELNSKLLASHTGVGQRD